MIGSSIFDIFLISTYICLILLDHLSFWWVFFRNDTVLIVCIFLSFTARYFSFLIHSYGFLCFLLRFYLIRKTRGRFILLFFLRVLSACFYTCIALLLSRLIFLYFIWIGSSTDKSM